MAYFFRNVILVVLLKYLRWGLSVVLYYTGIFHGVSILTGKLSKKNQALILRYHRILADSEKSIYEFGLPESVFAKQIKFLAQHYHVVGLNSVVATLRSVGRFAAKTVAITFDDGYRDNYEKAAPLLQQAALPATFFVTAGYLNNPDELPWWHQLALLVENYSEPEVWLTWNGKEQRFSIKRSWQKQRLMDELLSQLKQLPHKQFLLAVQSLIEQFVGFDGEKQPHRPMLDWEETRALASSGFQIGGHTMTHPILTRLTPVARELELRESKRLIEEKAETEVAFFSFPNGTINDVDLAFSYQLNSYGYQAAFTSIGGFVRPLDSIFLLKRKGVYGGTCTTPWGRFSPALFALELSGFYDWLFHRQGSPHG